MNTPVNPYLAPKANVGDINGGLNTSGGGKEAVIPEGVKGWSWGAFLLNWIWAVGNKSYIGLLALVPYIGFIVAIYLGIKGRELAWRNKAWDDLEHFNRVQKRWSAWGVGVVVVPALLGILAAILIPMFNR